jgi:serine/threonine-protein kinase
MSRIARFLPAATLLVVWLAAPGRAHAQADVCADQPQAQVLFDEGQRLFKESKFDAACGKLESSIRLCPRFLGARGRLAECYEKTGRLASAWASWRDVAGIAQKSGNDKDRARADLASKRAQALEARLAHISVKLAAGNTTKGLAILRDGKPVEGATLGVALPVDAGTHHVEASAPGFLPWRIEIGITDGASVPIEVPALAPEPEAPVANDRLVKDPAAQAAADDAARKRRKDRQITAIVVGGVGVVALGVGTFFGVDALGKTSDAKDAPYLCSDDGACPSPEGVALLEDARRSARTADLLIGAGIVAVGAGVALWFTAPHAPEEGAPAAGTSARLAPSVGAGSLGLVVSGGF